MAKKVRIVIEAEVPDTVPGFGPPEQSTLHAIHDTICDAFGEFISARTTPEEYVERRYGGKGYEWVKKDQKIAQVRARISIARALANREHGKFGKLEVTEIKEPGKSYAVVAYWRTASDCVSGDSNGTVLAVLKKKPTQEEMQDLLTKWAADKNLKLEDDFGDPTYGVECQETEIKE